MAKSETTQAQDASEAPKAEAIADAAKAAAGLDQASDRDALADQLNRLANYLQVSGYFNEGDLAGVVDVAIHRIELGKGYQASVEATAQVIDGLSVHLADQIVAKLVNAQPAPEARTEAPEVSDGDDVPNGTLYGKLHQHAARLEELRDAVQTEAVKTGGRFHHAFNELIHNLRQLIDGAPFRNGQGQ